jgi:hypothetical protein
MSKNSISIIAIFLVVTGSVVFVVSKKRQSQQPVSNQIETSVEESKKSDTLSTPTVSPVSTIQNISEITLTVTSPLSGSTVSSPKAIVSGKTDAKAEVFANEAEGIADANGNFSLSVALDEGENSIIVTAVDSNGKVAEKEILVTYEINE